MKRLTEIQERKYEGYVWNSDDKSPKILLGEKYKFEEDQPFPFILEALLFCKEENISVMVRHTGEYQICEFDLNHLKEGSELQEVTFLPHRLKDEREINIENVCFKQLWIPEEDELCEGWPVLKMQALIFTGFKY